MRRASGTSPSCRHRRVPSWGRSPGEATAAQLAQDLDALCDTIEEAARPLPSRLVFAVFDPLRLHLCEMPLTAPQGHVLALLLRDQPDVGPLAQNLLRAIRRQRHTGSEFARQQVGACFNRFAALPLVADVVDALQWDSWRRLIAPRDSLLALQENYTTPRLRLLEQAVDSMLRAADASLARWAQRLPHHPDLAKAQSWHRWQQGFRRQVQAGLAGLRQADRQAIDRNRQVIAARAKLRAQGHSAGRARRFEDEVATYRASSQGHRASRIANMLPIAGSLIEMNITLQQLCTTATTGLEGAGLARDFRLPADIAADAHGVLVACRAAPGPLAGAAARAGLVRQAQALVAEATGIDRDASGSGFAGAAAAAPPRGTGRHLCPCAWPTRGPAQLAAAVRDAAGAAAGRGGAAVAVGRHLRSVPRRQRRR